MPHSVSSENLVPTVAEIKAEYAALSTRVSVMDKNISEVVTSIKELRDSLTKKSEPQYALLISLAGFLFMVLSGFGYSFYQPIKDQQAKFEKQLETLDNQIVSRAEHGRQWQLNDRAFDRVEKAMEKNERRIERLEERLLAKP